MARRDFFKSTQQKRYKTGSYRNPHVRTQPRSRWKLFLYPGVTLIVLVGAFAFFFSHPWFTVTHVDISGVEYIDRSELEQTITDYLQSSQFIFFDHRNRFLFSSTTLAQTLETTFALASIDVGLREGRVFVTLEERTSNLLWRTGSRLYVVDLEGIIVREVVDSEDELLQSPNLSELPIFIDKNNVAVDIGDTIVKPEEVEQAFWFLAQVKELGITSSFIEIDRVVGKWVRLVSTDGYSILFDMTGDIEAQVGHLRVVLADQIEDITALEYIDLRFGDKVYYK